MHILDHVSGNVDKNCSILVVEDDLGFRALIVKHLLRHGFTVIQCTGVDLEPDGKVIGHELSKALDLNLRDFSVVLLDHYFQSRHQTGTTITPVFVEAGLVVIGMSSSSSANESMVRQGAFAARTKREFRQLILELDGYHG
jgi:DNA-binding response OmpR family regulator